MFVSEGEYLKALKDIISALTFGLQSAISMLENYERLSDEERKFLIDQMKKLVETSSKLYGPEPTKH